VVDSDGLCYYLNHGQAGYPGTGSESKARVYLKKFRFTQTSE